MKTTPSPETLSPSQNTPSAETSGGEGQSLDKIREILFGTQARRFDQRMEQLEERLIAECREVRQDAQQRLEALEVFVKKELSALSERLSEEGKARGAQNQAARRELEESAGRLGQELEAVNERLRSGQRELREEILAQAKKLMAEQQRISEESSATLERETRSLRSGKVNRSDLGALFQQLAITLADDEG